jgi:hypothetical protein
MQKLNCFSVALLVGALCLSTTARNAQAQLNENCTDQTCIFARTTGSGQAAISGWNTDAGYGIVGLTNAGIAVYGSSTTGDSVQGVAGSGAGVHGISTSGNGVYGQSAGSTASGTVGINSGQGYGAAGISSGNGTGVYGVNGSTTGWSGYFNGRMFVQYGINVNGTCIAGDCRSDLRLKKNVQPLKGALDELARLQPVTFEWKDPNGVDRTSATQMGFIAQEVEKVKPEWVGVDDLGFKTINMSRLPVMLVESVRTLKAENEALRSQSLDFQERIRALEAGRRPMISGFGEGGVGLGLLAVAGSLVVSRRKRSDRPVN